MSLRKDDLPCFISSEALYSKYKYIWKKSDIFTSKSTFLLVSLSLSFKCGSFLSICRVNMITLACHWSPLHSRNIQHICQFYPTKVIHSQTQHIVYFTVSIRFLSAPSSHALGAATRQAAGLCSGSLRDQQSCRSLSCLPMCLKGFTSDSRSQRWDPLWPSVWATQSRVLQLAWPSRCVFLFHEWVSLSLRFMITKNIVQVITIS